MGTKKLLKVAGQVGLALSLLASSGLWVVSPTPVQAGWGSSEEPTNPSETEYVKDIKVEDKSKAVHTDGLYFVVGYKQLDIINADTLDFSKLLPNAFTYIPSFKIELWTSDKKKKLSERIVTRKDYHMVDAQYYFKLPAPAFKHGSKFAVRITSLDPALESVGVTSADWLEGGNVGQYADTNFSRTVYDVQANQFAVINLAYGRKELYGNVPITPLMNSDYTEYGVYVYGSKEHPVGTGLGVLDGVGNEARKVFVNNLNQVGYGYDYKGSPFVMPSRWQRVSVAKSKANRNPNITLLYVTDKNGVPQVKKTVMLKIGSKVVKRVTSATGAVYFNPKTEGLDRKTFTVSVVGQTIEGKSAKVYGSSSLRYFQYGGLDYSVKVD